MNSKVIGNAYERAFSYKLSEWLTGEKGSDCCWRSINSGNRYTSRKKIGKETAQNADIICTDLKYQSFFDLFYLDCKSYQNFNSFIINPKNLKSNKLFLQWVKTVKECPISMYPIMPCNIRDRVTPDFIIVPYDLLFYSTSLMYYEIVFENIKYCFYLVLQDDFFNNNIWDIIIKENKNILIK